jgi:hypothetical protein
MNTNVNSSATGHAFATTARLAPHAEARIFNYSAARIGKIEEALSNARASRRAARIQLLQPLDSSGGDIGSLQIPYKDACDKVAILEQTLNDALVATL